MTARCVSCDDLTSEVAALTVERDRLAREVERLRDRTERLRAVVCVASFADDNRERPRLVPYCPIRALASFWGDSLLFLRCPFIFSYLCIHCSSSGRW